MRAAAEIAGVPVKQATMMFVNVARLYRMNMDTPKTYSLTNSELLLKSSRGRWSRVLTQEFVP